MKGMTKRRAMESKFELPFELEDFSAQGIDPAAPTDAKPGSEEKVRMLAARYAAGLPLWHAEDRTDHGPEKLEILEEADELL